MKKHLLTVLLAVCLVLALGTVSALAVDTALPDPVNGVITLEDDVEVNSIPLNETGETVIDLNGHTLTYTGSSTITANSGQILTITDNSGSSEGALISTNITGAMSFIAAGEGGTVNASNIIVRTTDTGTAFFARGEAATLNISNCNVYGGYYCVGTNSGTVDNYGVDITLEDSYFETTSTDYENCTIMINVDGELNIDNCTIIGDRQAVFVRAGNATINNSEIVLTGRASTADPSAWGSGNNVPKGALVVGSQTSNSAAAYMADAVCTIINTTIESESNSIPAVYVSSNNTNSNNYVADVNITGTGSIITGDIVVADGKTTAASTLIVENGAYITGNITNNSAASSVAVINGATVTGTTTDNSTDGTVYVEGSDDNSFVVMNTNTAKAYETLEAAIKEASSSDTITLVDDVKEQFSLTIRDKKITIVGNGFEANITPSAGATTKAFSLLNSELTLDGVNMTINGTENSNGNYDGTAFDVRNDGSVLNVVNNSVLNMNNLESAMVFANTSGATVIRGELNIEDSTVNFTNIDGNASNGGDWKVADSTVTFSNCGSHAMSVETLVANNSDIDITGAGLCGLYGQDIVLNNGTDVTITNSGSQLPKDNWNSTATYKYPVEIKKVDGNCGLIVNSDASITLVDNAKENNVIYMPDGTTLVNDGTINATVVVDENSDMNVLVFFDNGVQCDVQVVNDGETYTLPTPTRSGYEFRGWRDNSGELHKAGETVTVNSDMTFTAVWSAINIPDTYDIEIADAANGSVDTSLSNASAGSTITITATPDSGYSVASVTVTGPDGRIDVVRVNATTYTFKMPAGDVTVRVTFTDSDALPFTDVSAGQWFYDAVAYVYTNGMMEGDSATTFNPDGTMTRAMFWAVLGRIDGATITGTNWADQARDWAMAEGVSDGTDPNGLVTREQMVTMLWRYAGEPESTASLSAYTDADSVSDWAETAMRWAIDEGIITGMTDTTLVPQGTATRAQCAAIFMRFDQM